MFNIKACLAALLMCVGVGMAASPSVTALYKAMTALSANLYDMTALQSKTDRELESSSDSDLINDLHYSELMCDVIYEEIKTKSDKDMTIASYIPPCYDACLEIDFDALINSALSNQSATDIALTIALCKEYLRSEWTVTKKNPSPKAKYHYVCAHIKRLAPILELCQHYNKKKMNVHQMARFLRSLAGRTRRFREAG